MDYGVLEQWTLLNQLLVSSRFRAFVLVRGCLRDKEEHVDVALRVCCTKGKWGSAVPSECDLASIQGFTRFKRPKHIVTV